MMIFLFLLISYTKIRSKTNTLFYIVPNFNNILTFVKIDKSNKNKKMELRRLNVNKDCAAMQSDFR